MATRTRRPTIDPQVDSVLRAVAVTSHAKTMAEAREFELAATWAEAHPGDDVVEVVDDEGYLVMYGDQPLSLAGEGAPTVAEFCIPEFATAAGMSPVAGRKFIGAALEAKHRLPRLWARVMAGEVPAWKVRRITEHTHRLPAGGAQYVDVMLAPIAHNCTFAQIESTAMTAVEQYDHERFDKLRRQRHKHHYLDISLADTALNGGLVPIRGLLDPADARAVEAVIKERAHAQLADNPELDLDTRRAKALGLLADAALTGGDGSGARELVIYAHHDNTQAHGIVNVEGGQSPITTEQLAEWCRQANTKVSIRPVLDLTECLGTDCYAPTDRMREQVILTCPTCVFPGCGRAARGCDLDHIIPFHQGGTTTSWNLAPLCRLHHRLKTHGYWTYTRTSLTTFVWTSPMGRIYTNDLTHKRRRTH